MERITAEKPTFGYRSVVNERLGDYASFQKPAWNARAFVGIDLTHHL